MAALRTQSPETSVTGTVARMDPRVARTRAAVLQTATDLLVEGGPSALTIDAIVARSGVAKSTIYRHWPSRDEVLLAVIESRAPVMPEPDPGADVVTSIREAVRASAATLNDPEWARMVPAMLLLRNHEADIKAIDERLERHRHDVLGSLIERAATEGVVVADIDVPEAISFLFGPMLFAHLTETVRVDGDYADRIVDRFLAAYSPSAERAAGSVVG
jgi:AcrR family transcriptional regulator